MLDSHDDIDGNDDDNTNVDNDEIVEDCESFGSVFCFFVDGGSDWDSCGDLLCGRTDDHDDEDELDIDGFGSIDGFISIMICL